MCHESDTRPSIIAGRAYAAMTPLSGARVSLSPARALGAGAGLATETRAAAIFAAGLAQIDE